ncbi:AAA family ATPase [Phormidium sp. FACHB-1136]|uniref:ATP-binding protein n=1 Tax=Phormidium sp. FACHB-1136 TaxID=2692848 RepID=UPI0016849608|nr:AAA family ATPase [Phormidium sp. FACHB-1136]MBD2428939.1 AAA family ATPase [Phormidium sp. FACHB-1136]
MRPFEQWGELAASSVGPPFISMVDCQPFDRPLLVQRLSRWARGLGEIPVYLVNPGYAQVQRVTEAMSFGFKTAPAQLGESSIDSTQFLPWLVSNSSAVQGIFVLEGLDIAEHRYQVQNLFEQLRLSGQACYLLFVGEQPTVPLGLHGMVEPFEFGYPTSGQVRDAMGDLAHRKDVDPAFLDDLDAIVRAAQGLSLGEIYGIVPREAALSPSGQALAQRLLAYKVAKLRGRGLEFIGEPDVPEAAGLDLLNARLERITALLDPAAAQHNLKFPNGMVLWGLPGTGKSLSAKLAAKKLGVPLLSADWNGLRGATPTESLANLRFLLDTAEAMAPCVLYFDDFDKGFAGWDTDITAKQCAQKLLTWMQEHTAPVLTLATVNRLGMLPVELQRRLPEVFFFDLPHDGARYDIFYLHLAKYFPAFRHGASDPSPFTDEQWRELLTAYRLCIPDEIGHAVKRVAEDCFYQHYLDGRSEQPLALRFEHLLAQREAFTPALVREEGAMLEIRNKATYAKPVSSPDQSRFARPRQTLFGD